MKKLFILLLIFIFFLGIYAFSQAKENDPRAILQKTRLKLDDNPTQLIFAVKFLGFLPLASAQINLVGEANFLNKDVLKVEALAQTIAQIEKYFYATAQIESLIDKDTGLSLKFTQKTKIKGKEDHEKIILYDQVKNTMLYKGEERVIMPNTQDPLSAIFYIRKQDLSVGKEFKIYFNTNQKIYLMKTKVLAKTAYEINGTNLPVWTVEAQIQRADGSPYHQTCLKFYLLDNPTKTLLLIKVFSGIGIISAPLTSAI